MAKKKEVTQADIDREKIEDFLKDLTKLTRRTGVIIGGCGCCGSPYLTVEKPVNDGEYRIEGDGDNLTFG